MAINRTGQANPNDYVLGRGRLMAAELDSSGNPGPWRDLGNAPELAISIDVEDLTHVSSRKGARVTDKRIVLETTMNVSFALDEVQNFENLALWAFGQTSSPANVLSFAAHEMIAVGDVPIDSDATSILPRIYLVKDSSGGRAYDLQDSANLDLEENTGTAPITLIEGTDYTVDIKLGTVQLLDSTNVRTIIVTNGNGINATLSATGGVANVDRVQALTNDTKIVALRFELENPADADHEMEFLWPKVTLAPDGDFSLIGEEFAQLSFTGVAEQGDVGSEYAGESLVITDDGSA